MNKTFTKEIKERIFNVIPAGTWQMERILGLLEIIGDDSIPTACVDCSIRPSLRINEKFVKEYCKTDEHLMMLILHEIFHIVLGHTRLYKTITVIHNIAFDAIINSILCRQFQDEIYTSFFTQINTLDSLESRLLRPPKGWADKLEFHPEATRDEKKVLDLLYGKGSNDVTYEEIFNLLVKAMKGKNIVGKYRLLGNHEDQNQTQIDKALGSAIREITSKWPRPDKDLAGRDLGNIKGNWTFEDKEINNDLRKAIKNMLRKSGIIESLKYSNLKYRVKEVSRPIETVVPQAKDRRLVAWKKIHGVSPIIYRGTLDTKQRKRTPIPIAHVYMDVSGSMSEAIGYIATALKERHKDGDVKLYAFSTVVDEVTPQKIKQGIKNTFGTDINCILTHLSSIDKKKRPKKVLIVTDGYVGKANPLILNNIKGLKFIVGLTTNGFEGELKSLGADIYRLPL
jgi:predicted metal-dependent peptidase